METNTDRLGRMARMELQGQDPAIKVGDYFASGARFNHGRRRLGGGRIKTTNIGTHPRIGFLGVGG